MSNLKEAKLLGGIGSILMLGGAFIPFVGVILPVVGLIILFVAVKYIADETKNEPIFKNFLLHFICSLIAIVAVIGIIAITIGSLGLFSVLESEEFTEFADTWEFTGAFIGGIIVALVVGWVLLVVGSMYLRKSYNKVAEHTKVDMFKTTGTIYSIGAITLIVLIGIIILFIAKILEIVSFFSLPDNLPQVVEISTSKE